MKKIVFLVFISLSFAAIGQIKVACVGNSITYGAGIEGRDSLAYPQQLQQILGADWEVKNFGNSGSTLLKNGNKPYWQQAEYKTALAFEPDVVIIKLGTNDSKPINWDEHKNEYVSDYQDLIATFRALPSNPIIILALPIPVVEDRWGISKNVVETEIPVLIKQIAKAEKVEILDFYQPMLGHEDLIPDKIHPNAEGATIMANTAAKFLQPKKKKFVKHKKASDKRYHEKGKESNHQKL